MSNEVEQPAVDEWYMNMSELVAERVARKRAIKALDAGTIARVTTHTRRTTRAT